MVFIADVSSVRDAPFDILMVCVCVGGRGGGGGWHKYGKKYRARRFGLKKI